MRGFFQPSFRNGVIQLNIDDIWSGAGPGVASGLRLQDEGRRSVGVGQQHSGDIELGAGHLLDDDPEDEEHGDDRSPAETGRHLTTTNFPHSAQWQR